MSEQATAHGIEVKAITVTALPRPRPSETQSKATARHTADHIRQRLLPAHTAALAELREHTAPQPATLWRADAALARFLNATAEAEGHEKRQIKAYVRADLVGRDAWTRFLSLIENHQRQGMSPKDTLKAAELSLIGMDEVEQKQAARALGLKRGTGKRLGRAQQLDDATLRRTSAGGMDLEQIAQLAEVEDVPGAQDRLLRALARDEAEDGGGRGHWDQELALLKAEQDDRTARKEAVAALEKAEIPMLPTRVPYGEKDTARALSELTTPLGRPLDEDNHKGCPGHSARLDDEHQPVWYCADPSEYGHKVRPKPKPEKTAEDEEKAAERARTTVCNRAWKAAVGPADTAQPVPAPRPAFRRRFPAGRTSARPIPRNRRRDTLMPTLAEIRAFVGQLSEVGQLAAVQEDEAVPVQPPTDDRTAVDLYYGPERNNLPDEGYSLYPATISGSGRARVVPLDFRFPKADACDQANRDATFHPQTDANDLPCIEVDGVLVFVYLDHELGAVRVSIHLDTAPDRLVRPDGTVPLRVKVEDTVVLDDSDTEGAPRPPCWTSC
ncbi:hypothetical protein ACFYRD_37380 [Streptomyces hirsutus]|uniref:hypothetical protein n=1 Tax=Streptomyces hirsutus TaxID=35620 RepID=UPI0036AF80E5